jgi:N-carbamoylputrescine amidase
MLTLTAGAAAPLSRSTASDRPALRVGLVRHRWRDDADELAKVLRDGIDRAEDLTEGPTFAPAAEAARANGIFVHASLYEKAPADDGLLFNTAILVSPSGELVGRTREMHIPVSAGYYEDTYFRPGPAPRDEEAVLAADLDLDQRRDWLELFPFLLTRRPDGYAALTAPVDAEHPYGAGHLATAVVK